MSFKSWCLKNYGIIEIAEGKILNCIFIPALANSRIKLPGLIKKSGGFVVHTHEYHGLVLPYDSNQKLHKLLPLHSRFAI